MSETTFYINGKNRAFSIKASPEFSFGKDELLSTKVTDITFGQHWYEKGFTEEHFLDEEEYKSLKKGLADSITKIIDQEIGIDTIGFKLENYHHFVKNDKDHYKVVARTRDLFEEDFNFPIFKYLPRFEKILKFKLTNYSDTYKVKLHVIVRINRPHSHDFNPPHKDMYEPYDKESVIPQFLNFWIPVAGISDKTNLPLAPNSHRINENKILRTFEGGIIEENKYRVRMIKSWDGKTDLKRSTVKYREALIFSSHLIHGLAINEEEDKTRVALEFRLFKAL